MNPLFIAALEMQQFLRERRWRFCFIGGLTVARWGQARATHDVDLSLLTGFSDEQSFIRPILQAFPARRANAEEFALRARVVLVEASNGVPIDIGLAGWSYEEEIMDRASEYEFAPGVVLHTVSAEDLVVMKAFADRDGDWKDVAGIRARQSKHLNWDRIVPDLTALCETKDAPEIVDRLLRLRDDLQRR